MILSNNLFEEVINKESSRYNKLRIISGYASGTFLKKVATSCPKLEITLFIGMTQNGITLNDHIIFQNLTKDNKIKVFYQVKEVQNHMKLYEFYNESSSITYVGSANFSENGFFKQRELLAPIEAENDLIFENQLQNSVICTTPKIEEIIAINNNQNTIFGEEETSEIDINAFEVSGGELSEYSKRNSFFQFRNYIDDDFDKISVEILGNSNKKWSYEGINGIFNRKSSKSILITQTGHHFDRFFPKDSEFYIHSDIGIKYKARIGGRFNKELYLLDGSFYDYVNMHLNLSTRRPINKDDLENFGCTHINFERINESLYLIYMEEDHNRINKE